MAVGEMPRGDRQNEKRGKQPSCGIPGNNTVKQSQALEAKKLQSLRYVENLERERERERGAAGANSGNSVPQGFQQGRCGQQVQTLGRVE